MLTSCRPEDYRRCGIFHCLHYELTVPTGPPATLVCFYHTTYVLTPWCRVLHEQLTGLQLVNKFPRISRNPNVHYRTHKRPPPDPILGQPNPVQCPHPTSWRSILILSTHLGLGLSSDLFPSDYLLTYSLHGAESFLRS